MGYEPFFPNFSTIQVIPPPQWKPTSSAYKSKINDLMINGPIEQNIFGKGGVYECLHIQKKSLSLREYKSKMEGFDKTTKQNNSEHIEEMVGLLSFSFGRALSSPLLSTGLTS